ncbi:MAG: helix-hairpin-helix domain-containing protein, partial [Georgenia sp.]
MEVHARHDGAALPFERDRRLVLRRLPAGTVLTRAVFTLTPVSTDAGRRFLETISLPTGTGSGTWGATKVVTSGTNGALEIDLHARRRLASLTGTGLTTAPLLVDLGGGFMAVDSGGGFSDGPPYLLSTADLPGLTVTGLRVPAAGAEASALRVSSPPSNVSLAVAGGPVFFSHFGDLVEPVTTPDVADLLQALLPDLDIEHGCHVVSFVLHSDSITRLDVTLDLELELAVAATPPGVRTVVAPYRYDGAPVAGGHLAVAVPHGMVAVPGETAGRVQGAFAATRVVHGQVTDATATGLVLVEAGQGLAQPFVTATTEVFTSLDLLLSAVTAEARVAVDLVGDLDGKPGRASLLPRPAELALTRDSAGAPTWLNVTLPGEVEAVAARRTWLVVQSLAGTVTWSAATSPADEG